MNSFDQVLTRQLEELEARGLYRQLRRVDSPQTPALQVDGRACLNFSSNDYLGLATEPSLREAAARALAQFGAGSGSARLLCGSLTPHHELEEALASFKGSPAALAFASGYAAALGTVPALVNTDDVVVVDKRVHACLVDAARLSGATLRVFPHNDLDRLEHLLRWARQRPAPARSSRGPGSCPRVLIITESVFSMDGDQAPLPQLVALKERYGAWLMVDEAHATGLYGPHRRGLADALGVASNIEVQMGTLGKALGAAGGFICGSRALIDYLVNHARTFIFSTAPVPAAAAAATAGVQFVRSEAGQARCAALWARVAQLRQPQPPATSPPPVEPAPDQAVLSSASSPAPSAILPLIVGDENEALTIAARLRDQGFFIPAVRYPTVPRRSARLRITLSAIHTAAEVARLREALSALGLTPPAAA